MVYSPKKRALLVAVDPTLAGRPYFVLERAISTDERCIALTWKLVIRPAFGSSRNLADAAGGGSRFSERNTLEQLSSA